MPDVRIEGRRLWIGDQPHALLSGEIHFWRVSPARWRTLLDRARELGLEMVATYVCWDYHALGDDCFDFTGATDPGRNLVGFLELAAEMGLWLMVRPGPYFYGEWRNAGVPDSAARWHRLHPEFRRQASAWLAAVTAVLRPFLATAGGPIALVQAENEPDPWPHIYETQLGFGAQPGLFQDFLRERYAGDLAALNAAWESALDSFEAARPVTQAAVRRRGYLNRYLDFWRFRHWAAAESVRWTVAQLRAGGIDVPITANAYTIHGIQNWRDLEAACDLCGPDPYPANEFAGAPGEHRDFLHMLRYTRAYSALPFVPEMESGIWEGGQGQTGPLTPNHVRMLCLSALLAGIVGWNWYMLVNRDNWLMAPVNELGNLRPDLFETYRAIVAAFHQLDPPALRKLTHTAATVEVLDRTTRLDPAGDRVIEALYAAGIDYDCFDVATGQIARPLLFVAGGDVLDAAAQDRLLAYVEAGGNLVWFQPLPLRDDSLRPLDRFGLPEPSGVLGAGYPNRLRLALGDRHVTLSSPSFFAYENVPGEPLVAERAPDAEMHGDELSLHVSLPVGARYVVGWREQRGAGTITGLGVEPSPAVVAALHAWLGLTPPCRARSGHVSTALFARGAAFALIAINQGDEDRHAIVDLDPALFEAGVYTVRDLFRGEAQQVDLRAAGQITIWLPRKDGTALLLEPAAQ